MRADLPDLSLATRPGSILKKHGPLLLPLSIGAPAFPAQGSLPAADKRKTTMTNIKRILIVVLAILICSVLLVLAAHKRIGPTPTAVAQQPTVTPGAVKRRDYVRRSMLRSKLGWALNQLGDRLEKPGKERINVSGSLQYGKNQISSSVRLVGEFPDRAQLRLVNSGTERVITFDRAMTRAASQPSELEEALLETLVYDTADHFFWSQTQQQATRFIGSRFRTDDGSDANYQGPYYDVYQITEPIKISANEQVRTKFYYFNSDTLLLEKVVYQTNRQGRDIRVEVELSDWRSVSGQRIPHRIERREDGNSVLVVSLSTVNVGPKADDGTFDAVGSN